ncbi:MAG: hypothetical protein ACLFVU_04165 [Phycisphaerae bacterium]
MPKRRANMQFFALPGDVPETITLGGASYRRQGVFKHDFFAATCLYRTKSNAPFEQIVVKFGRTQPFCGIPCDWYAEAMLKHEQAIYRTLTGTEGVPRWAGTLSRTAYAIEYIDAKPLDHLDSPPPGFFDRLAEIFRQIHQRGVGYGDANKRSNILADSDGNPWLVDFQISLRLREDWPTPLRQVNRTAVRYFQRADIYHLYKHKRRLARHELRPEEEQLSRRRGLLHTLHRKLTDPWRRLRRKFLKQQHRKGALRSPTGHLEEHHQPEKATWRDEVDAK